MTPDELEAIREEHTRICIACNHTDSGPCSLSLLLAEVDRLHDVIADMDKELDFWQSEAVNLRASLDPVEADND